MIHFGLRGRGARGFSLVEVIMATVLFTVISLVFFTYLTASLRAHERQQLKADLYLQGLNALNTIKTELRGSGKVTSTGGTAYPAFFTNGTSSAPYNAGHTHAYTAPNLRTGLNVATDVLPVYMGGTLANSLATIAPNAPPVRFLPPPATGPTGGVANGAIREIIYVKALFGTPINAADSADAGFNTGQQPLLNSQGEVQWDFADEYDFALVTDTDGILSLQHRVFGGGKFPDGATVHTLAKHVQWIYVEDNSVDATLGTNQLRVSLWLLGRDAQKNPESSRLETIVTMRNKQ